MPALHFRDPVLSRAYCCGLSSMISLAEVVVSALIDKINMSRKVAATVFCGLGFVVSIAFTTGGGLLLLDIVDHFINNFGILMGGFIEIIFVAWFCKLDDLRNHVNLTSEIKVGSLWMNSLRFVIPAMLGFMLVQTSLVIFPKTTADTLLRLLLPLVGLRLLSA